MSHDFEPTEVEKEMLSHIKDIEVNRKQFELGDIVSGAILDGQNQIHDLYKEKATAQEVEYRMRRSYTYWMNKLQTTLHQELQKTRESERERINQFFAVKADYDTDNDCVILTDKVYHQAFFPDGCGSDGQDGRNRCEICYKYRTKFGQNVLAKLEPDQSELDQPNK